LTKFTDDYIEKEADLIQSTAIENRKGFGFRSCRTTYCLVAINILAFFILPIAVGRANALNPIYLGASCGSLTFRGEWWRLISSNFVHVELFHILSNMIGLWFAGCRVEKIVGSLRFLAIFMFCGVFSDIAFLFADPYSGSYGASGGVGGAIGGLIVVYVLRTLQQRKRLWLLLTLSPFAVLYLILMFTSAVSQIVHVSALLCGALLTLAFLRYGGTKRRDLLLTFAATALLVIFAIVARAGYLRGLGKTRVIQLSIIRQSGSSPNSFLHPHQLCSHS
jgi:rhomboid protease GluP